VPDPDDAWIIAAALNAGADLFVTGDKALLELGAVQGLPIIDPRTAYARLRGLG
jgi:predicted nucleic acid-binding protein